MKHIAILYGLLAFLLAGCISHSEQRVVMQLSPSIKTETKALNADTLSLAQEFLYAKQYFVYQDTVLIVINTPSEDAPFIELYNLTNNQQIGGYIRLGKGPGEMLLPFIELEQNTLKISDPVRQQLTFIDLDVVLKSPENYHIPSFEKCQVFSYGKNRLANGQLVFENPYCFYDKRSGLGNKTYRLLIGDSNTTDTDFGEFDYQTRNIAQGNLFLSPTKDKLIYIPLRQPNIEIYDTLANPLKTIQGPDDFHEVQYKIYDKCEVIFGPLVPYTYLAYTYNNDYFYVAYTGDLIDFQTKSEKDLHTWIFQFDWDGNFIDSYYYPAYINAISISKDGRSIYATSHDPDNMPILVRLSTINN
ncbi:hypothetical protein [uncultured Rikenella sp.]|uniref:hypothetical protein n=1 Tax=uncultured Rikenella sp. TaxID=368003 RepID=UPI0025D3915A|nr:hypothetical protein [uncultured Rikenella sp.]